MCSNERDFLPNTCKFYYHFNGKNTLRNCTILCESMRQYICWHIMSIKKHVDLDNLT